MQPCQLRGRGVGQRIVREGRMRAPVAVGTQAAELLELLTAKEIELVAKVLEQIALDLEQALDRGLVAAALLLLQAIELGD